MNFKEEYQKENNNVVPDPAFMARLEEQMKELNRQQNEEQPDEEQPDKEQLNKEPVSDNKKMSYNKNKIIAVISVVAAACLCIVVYNFSSSKIDKEKLQQKAELENVTEGRSDSDVNDGMFSIKKWYDENMQPEEIYQAFLDRVSNRNSIKVIYFSENPDEFNENTILEENDKEQLLSDLQKTCFIESLNEKEEDVTNSNTKSESAKYYMITFTDDVIIKFCIKDKKVILNDMDFQAIYE